MSTLTDALEQMTSDARVTGWITPDNELSDAVRLVVEAARRVANPDYQAAWDMYKRGEGNFERCKWVVNAALGIEDPG